MKNVYFTTNGNTIISIGCAGLMAASDCIAATSDHRSVCSRHDHVPEQHFSSTPSVSCTVAGTISGSHAGLFTGDFRISTGSSQWCCSGQDWRQPC